MWASKEQKYTDFNDIRLNNRLEKILQDFTEEPAGSIPQACKSAASTKATYRFLSNENVEGEKIRKGFSQATIERIVESKEETVLYVSDATNVVYTSHKQLEGIGVLRNQRARGLNLHTTLAVTEKELVLGSVHQCCWGRKEEEYGKRALRRKKPIEQKESYRWIDSFNASQNALPENVRGIFLGDRGADIYDLFLLPRKENMHIVIRSLHNRNLKNSPNKIFSEIENTPCSGTMKVKIPRSGNRKERRATLEIRYNKVTIKPPFYKKDMASTTLTIVSATEITKNLETENFIKWKLLTTLPINSLDQAIYTISTYSKRWIIERYHYTLKQGCKIEELQLEQAERIDKAIALYTIIACRIMYMTYLSRISPDLLCTTIFNNQEWRALYCYANKTSYEPEHPLTIRQAILMLAKMGGFLGRKQDGDPGVKVIWIGMRLLEGAVEMYRILKGNFVGNV